MKKIFMSMAMLPFFMFTSCSSDDDNEAQQDNHDPALIGTWIEDTDREVEVYHKIFKADGTLYHWATNNGEIDANGKISYQWHTEGNTLYFVSEEYGEEQAQYKVDGNMFTTISQEGEEILYKKVNK